MSDTGGAAFHCDVPGTGNYGFVILNTLDYFAAAALPTCLADAGENAGALAKKILGEVPANLNAEESMKLLEELEPQLVAMSNEVDRGGVERYRIAEMCVAEKRRREGAGK